MPVEGSLLEALERRLDGARLWGLELDLRYRVAAATFEKRPDGPPLRPVEDSRLQLLLFPVGRVSGALHESADEPPRRFPIERLVEVVSSFEGPTVTAPCSTRPSLTLAPHPASPAPALRATAGLTVSASSSTAPRGVCSSSRSRSTTYASARPTVRRCRLRCGECVSSSVAC